MLRALEGLLDGLVDNSLIDKTSGQSSALGPKLQRERRRNLDQLSR
jgi:hypothetical protein